MPLYEYQCASCGVRFERIQRFADPLVEVCPSCGQGPVNKLLSASAVHFKGSGWYVTDYAKKGSESAGQAEDKAGDKASDKASDKAPEAASSSGRAESSKPAAAESAAASAKSESGHVGEK